MTVPRGKLVPIRAVIRDNTTVVQKGEPTLVPDDNSFQPVNVNLITKQQPQQEPSYSNGYADDVIYPLELHERYEEEREVKAVKPSEYDPSKVDYNQNVDDGVKRMKTWKSVDELTPMERSRLSTAGSEKELQSPKDKGPQSPIEGGPHSPRERGPHGPRERGPNVPRERDPHGPRESDPQGPKGSSGRDNRGEVRGGSNKDRQPDRRPVDDRRQRRPDPRDRVDDRRDDRRRQDGRR